VVPNLDPLAGLTDLPGGLGIERLTQIESLAGLHNLQHIGGPLSIAQADKLTDLQALAGLTEILDTVELTDLPALPSLEGLHNLERVRRLRVDECPLLMDLDGLRGLQRVEEYVVLEQLSLTDLHGLEGLTELGEPGGETASITMQYMPNLASLDALAVDWHGANAFSISGQVVEVGRDEPLEPRRQPDQRPRHRRHRHRHPRLPCLAHQSHEGGAPEQILRPPERLRDAAGVSEGRGAGSCRREPLATALDQLARACKPRRHRDQRPYTHEQVAVLEFVRERKLGGAEHGGLREEVHHRTGPVAPHSPDDQGPACAKKRPGWKIGDLLLYGPALISTDLPPVLLEVTAGAERTEPQDGFGAGDGPARAGDVHAVLDEVARVETVLKRPEGPLLPRPGPAPNQATSRDCATLFRSLRLVLHIQTSERRERPAWSAEGQSAVA
jgi:hypothetical protein